MTYFIKYSPKAPDEGRREVFLFDIEYYLKECESSSIPNAWQSEIFCVPIAEGFTIFLKDKFEEEGFDHNVFIKDSDKIQEIRKFLFEEHDNSPKEHGEARNFHYNVFGREIDSIFSEFCDKYGLDLEID